jgi:hypothetical protein
VGAVPIQPLSIHICERTDLSGQGRPEWHRSAYGAGNIFTVLVSLRKGSLTSTGNPPMVDNTNIKNIKFRTMHNHCELPSPTKG